MERKETFDEVFEECASVQVWDLPNGPMNYARRLKAAHDREVETLKASLKPVLECDLEEDDRNINCALMRFHKAIREAKSIYREGKVK